MSTCRASCAARLGRNPNEHANMSASKIGSSTIFTAACTTRSATEGIDKRPLLRRPGLGNEHPAGWKRTPTTLPQLRGHLVQQPGHPVLLDIGDGDPVDTRRAAIAAHVLPRPLQDVPAIDLVPQRVEPSPGIGLGRPVQRMLQGTNRVHHGPRRGGTSRNGTHRAPPRRAIRTDEAAALPSPAVVLSARLQQYYGRLRRPPGTTSTSRRQPVIGPASPVTTRRPPGRGGPPQFPSSLSERSTPHTPEGSWRLRFQVLHRVHGLHRDFSGSAPSAPTLTGRTSNDAAGFASCCGPPSCSPKQGFRHWASTRTVSNPSRQSATGPPDSYPDRTHTGKRRRARTAKITPLRHEVTSRSTGRTNHRG